MWSNNFQQFGEYSFSRFPLSFENSWNDIQLHFWSEQAMKEQNEEDEDAAEAEYDEDKDEDEKKKL